MVKLIGLIIAIIGISNRIKQVDFFFAMDRFDMQVKVIWNSNLFVSLQNKKLESNSKSLYNFFLFYRLFQHLLRVKSKKYSKISRIVINRKDFFLFSLEKIWGYLANMPNISPLAYTYGPGLQKKRTHVPTNGKYEDPFLFGLFYCWRGHNLF